MPFDAHQNLAISTVATAPIPPTSGLTITVTSGEGARFPAAPFNATVWAVSQPPTPITAEIVRVTARSGDTLTLIRAQEGTIARSIIAGDLIAETITAKAFTDLESGTNFPLITTGAVTATGVNVVNPGGNLTLAGNVIVGPSGSADIRQNTVDGADTGSLVFCGGGGDTANRGARINMLGNEHASGGGRVIISTGDVPTGTIQFVTGPGTVRGTIYSSGGFGWGGPPDPGAGNLEVGAGGLTYLRLTPGRMIGSVATSAQSSVHEFYSAGTIAGNIAVSGGNTTTYNSASDARLKTSRGRHTDADVLRRTVVHDFVWKADGTPGRGVFAQEAHTVAPFAVSVGTDERDDEGRLKKPWGVDYSKYVPDLIVGWQQHDATLDALRAEVEALQQARYGTAAAPPPPPSVINRVMTAIGVWVGRSLASQMAGVASVVSRGAPAASPATLTEAGLCISALGAPQRGHRSCFKNLRDRLQCHRQVGGDPVVRAFRAMHPDHRLKVVSHRGSVA